MRNIKILILLITALTISLISLSTHEMYVAHNFKSEPIIISLIYISIIILVLIISGSVTYALYTFLKKGYFNMISARFLKLGGVLYLIFGLFVLGQSIYIYINTPTLFQTELILQYYLIKNGFSIVVGFAMITISDILKKGALLRQENDLTI